MPPSARSNAAKVLGSLIHVNPAKGADMSHKVEEIEPIPKLGWVRRNFFDICPQYVPVLERQNRRPRHFALQNAPTYAHRRYGSH